MTTGQDKRSRRSRKPKKPDLSAKQINTQLFEPDQLVFDRERSRFASDADLLRHIVHDWAKKKRLSGSHDDELEMTVRRVHEKILSEQLEPVRETIGQILNKLGHLSDSGALAPVGSGAAAESLIGSQASESSSILELLRTISGDLSNARNEISDVAQTVVTASSQQGEQLSLNEALTQRLLTLNKAHFMLSGQSFASTWAALDFIQRYIAEPVLKSLQKEDPYEASITHRDDARMEGLLMVLSMCKIFQFPGSIEMTLVNPPEEP